MKTFWSFLIVFLLIDAWMYKHDGPSFIWGHEQQIIQAVSAAVHNVQNR